MIEVLWILFKVRSKIISKNEKNSLKIVFLKDFRPGKAILIFGLKILRHNNYNLYKVILN